MSQIVPRQGHFSEFSMSIPSSGGNKQRRGEKIGWLAGWLGGFIWLAILSLIWLIQGRTVAGIAGMFLFALAVITIHRCSPWRHPATAYIRLMLPIYALLLAAIGLCVWLMEDAGRCGFKWPSVLALTPAALPLIIAGRRRWNDGESRPGHHQSSSGTEPDP